MRRIQWFGMLAMVATLLGGAVSASGGLMVVRDMPEGIVRVIPPMPRPTPPHYAFAPLEVKYHHVTVTISNQVAVTEVDQSFYNPNNQRLEGTYIFPLPRGAQIDRFAMDIDGKTVEAELLDADKARTLYEDIVRKLKDPALLEYAEQGLFKARVYPIEPKSEKRVRVRYTQLLKHDGGLTEYRYPLNTEKFSAQPLRSISIKVELATKMPLTTVYSSSHNVDIRRDGANRAVIGFEASDVRPDADFHLLFAQESQADVGVQLLTFTDETKPSGGWFALFATPAPDMTAGRILPKDVVFALDTSGSMADDNKLDQAKKALRFCLKNLNPDDRFELVRFSTEAEPLFGKLASAEPAAIRKAEAFIQNLKPAGGTAIEDALLKSLAPAPEPAKAGRPYFVVFLTDGQPTIGTIDIDVILNRVAKEAGDRRLRVFCFGLGTDVNTHLLDRLAEQTRAATTYVLPSENLEVKVSSFYAKINDPVLADVQVAFEGAVRASQMHPSVLPDLFKDEQLVVFGRYAGSGAVAIKLTGQVNGEPRAFTMETTVPERAAEHAFIPRLWAMRRVGWLLDQIRLHGESKELKDEVSDLARRYGIVTPYTAFLILEDEVQRNVPETVRTLPMVTRRAGAREQMAVLYDRVGKEESGSDAVCGAMALGFLKFARSAAAPTEASASVIAGRSGRHAAGGRLVADALEAQPLKHLGGRTFSWNGTQWIDAEVQRHPDAKRIQIVFGSDAYFDLVARHPAAAPWFAAGPAIQLWLEGNVFDIVTADQ